MLIHPALLIGRCRYCLKPDESTERKAEGSKDETDWRAIGLFPLDKEY